MASKNLGRVGFVPKGEYDPETEYNRLDVVSYQGAAYVVRVDGLTGVTPGTDPDSYLVLVDNAASVAANQAAAAANAAAEAVSGDVADLKSAFDTFAESNQFAAIWGRGGLSSSSGLPNANNASKRCRTAIIALSDYIIVSDGLSRFFVYFYSGGEGTSNYLGNSGEWLTLTNVQSYASEHYPTADMFKLVGSKIDDSQIGDGESADVSDCTSHICILPGYMRKDTKALVSGNVLTAETDFDDVEYGVYRATTTDVAADHNRPSVLAGVLMVLPATNTYLKVQLYINTVNAIYYRCYAQATWSEWVKLLSSADNVFKYQGVIANVKDFDEVGHGVHQIAALPKGTDISALNRPSRLAGVLCCYLDSNFARATQIFVNHLSIMYYRVMINGTWRDWQQVNNDKTSGGASPSNSWGIANLLANSEHIKNIKWTPVGNMPKTTKNTRYTDPLEYFALTEQTGVPYSSVRDQDKAVGMDVSVHTFMTAVKDPNSVLYTRRSIVSNATTYYGTVCSGMVNVAMGYNLDLTNYYLSESDMFETVPMQSIQTGDMIWVDGHCALILDVTKDDYGRIKTVTVREEWRPLPRDVKYASWNAFMNARQGYIARRYKNLGGIPYNGVIPYVQNFDEDETEIVYPDVQTDHGDRAVFKVGEDVRINVINSTGYDSIVVQRDDDVVYQTTDIQSFVLENVQSGLYTVTASGDGVESVSTFFVVDCAGSFDVETGIVTFSSTNAVPVLVNVYSVPSDYKILCYPIVLSDQDRAAGQIDVSDYMDAAHRYAKVTFKTDYGTAVWYSEDHQRWLPI